MYQIHFLLETIQIVVVVALELRVLIQLQMVKVLPVETVYFAHLLVLAHVIQAFIGAVVEEVEHLLALLIQVAQEDLVVVHLVLLLVVLKPQLTPMDLRQLRHALMERITLAEEVVVLMPVKVVWAVAELLLLHI